MLKRLRPLLPHAVILICNMYIVFFLIDRVNAAMNFIDNGLTKGLLMLLCLLGAYNAWNLTRRPTAPRRPAPPPRPRRYADTYRSYDSRPRRYDGGYRYNDRPRRYSDRRYHERRQLYNEELQPRADGDSYDYRQE